jgi:hypothetical protein
MFDIIQLRALPLRSYLMRFQQRPSCEIIASPRASFTTLQCLATMLGKKTKAYQQAIDVGSVTGATL